jgi:hypothetical protein
VTRSGRLPALPLTALVVALTAVLAAALAAPALGAAPAADPRPTAVVALGDSVAAGDGAGDYEPGTRGEGGNWCHRSRHAYVHRTGLAAESVNLACSGAESADVAFGAGGHHTEGSQAARLVEVAGRFRVTTVVVQLGANDDAALTATGIACIRAFLDPTVPPCRQTLAPLLDGRMAATATKVEAAVGDVRAAMRRAGYRDGGYELVLLSYASPVTERMVGVQGCSAARTAARTPGGGAPCCSRGCPRRWPGRPSAAGPGSWTWPGPPRGTRPARGRRSARSGSGGSPCRPRRSPTAGWTPPATTWPRSRSTPRPPGTRSSGSASVSSSARRCPPRPACRRRAGLQVQAAVDSPAA